MPYRDHKTDGLVPPVLRFLQGLLPGIPVNRNW